MIILSRAGIVVFVLFLLASALSAGTIGRQSVSFRTADTGEIFADLYGKSDRCVVLAHGGQFSKQSWEPQARQIAAAGFCVLAIDFRGYGKSWGPGQDNLMNAPLYQDVLAAVRYLHRLRGAKSVSVIGGSMGGSAAARASMEAEEGEIDRLVLIASILDDELPDKLKGRKLFVVARNDTRGDGVVRLQPIREQYAIVPEPKKLLILEGSAHAQYLFETDQADQLMKEIIAFLTAP